MIANLLPLIFLALQPVSGTADPGNGAQEQPLDVSQQGALRCSAAFALIAERQKQGDAAALEYQDRLMPLHLAIFVEPGLVGAKYAMSRLGLCDERVRLPLVGLTDPTRRLIDAALDHAGLN